MVMSHKIFRLFGARKTKNATSNGASASVEHARIVFQQGQFADAADICRGILDRLPSHFDAVLLSAEIAAEQRNLEQAIELYAMAIDLRPGQPIAYYKRGNLMKDTGRLEEALESYDKAVAFDFSYSHAYCNRGVVLERLNRLDEARNSYDQAIALNPKDVFAYYNRAAICQALSQPEDALADYNLAITLKPDYSEALCNRGLLLAQLRRWNEALASYSQCIENDPAFYQAHFNRGALLKDRGQLEAARASYDSAIQIRPDYADAYCNRGVVLMELGRPEEALASHNQAILLKPGSADAYSNRAETLTSLNRFEDAVADYDCACNLDPKARFLAGALHAKSSVCDWRNFESELTIFRSALETDLCASQPFFVLGLLDSPTLQKKAAEAWVNEMCPPDDSLGPIPKRQRRDKVRIGYFSADFREHAVAHLIAELIETHDRSRFEVVGFSFGPDTGDRYRKRLERSFDQFADVRTNSHSEIATLARDLGIDIALDLGGYTKLSRPGVFALRAAPLQVSYLGYPGTMGARYFDYAIADRTLVPPQNERHFTENIIYLPHSYQANDSKRVIAGRVFTRAELGLPAGGFVFCCFNNNYKILPFLFDIWMRILKRVEGSVLWLLAGNEAAVCHLRQQALARAVDPNRLIFAPRMTPSEHLARHRAADLFLDTVPYNAHTTASDALWAGLPLITCSGDAFASRVAASLIRAIDLPELIAVNLEDYEKLAVELASCPHRLTGIKERLAKNILVNPLFDTELFVKHIEAAYLNIYERYLADLPPAAIHVIS